uniref:Transthyretin-like family protein n=1 Tax=Parastrongyloides trichosuri TaxID=131310 RepID=A0A0N4ZLX8_PARTI
MKKGVHLYLSMILPIVIFLPVNGKLFGSDQATGAMGRLICNGKPAAKVLVKLYDENISFFPDNLLATTYTDSDGYLKVEGYAYGFSWIDPKVVIYHDCNVISTGSKRCFQRITFYIPKNYINYGRRTKRYYNIKDVELGIKYDGQDWQC